MVATEEAFKTSLGHCGGGEGGTETVLLRGRGDSAGIIT